MWNVDQKAQMGAGEVAWGRVGEGADLVLAHGWPWSSFSWHRVIPKLAGQYRVHWFDMPGYGRSEKNADRSTALDVQGETLSEMLAFWELRAPLIVAHDVGGAVTLRAHLLHGIDFAGMVLIDIVALSPWGSDFFDHVGKHGEAFSGLPPHIHTAVVRAYIEGALVNPLQADDLDQLCAPWLDEDGQQSFYRQFALADERYTREIEGKFGSVRCPVHILWGESDPWIPVDRGTRLHGMVPGSEFHLLKSLGHLPQLEAPERVASEIAHALQSIQTVFGEA